MSRAKDPAVKLAQRLRGLRKDRRITQRQLADALGGSVPLISSWENLTRPVPPPLERIQAYALFFAGERVVDTAPYRPLDRSELDPSERVRYDGLLTELSALRNAARGRVAPAADPGSDSLLRFPPGESIVIVCAPIPPEIRSQMPYPDSADPDYAELYSYTDVDALLELYGRLCTLNSDNNVRRVLSSELGPADYDDHLILLGGVDWNGAARDLMQRSGVPVRQIPRDQQDGWFEVDADDEVQRFEPKLFEVAGSDQRQLEEDVAHFYYGSSPYQPRRKVMSFNGMYGRGTFGAVRALTDPALRDGNEAYVKEGIAEYDQRSLLMRVQIVDGVGRTPNWTVPGALLHEWSHKAEPDGWQGSWS